MADKTETFLLEEYKALRKEIEMYISESRSLERSTLAAVGLIWGWLITSRNDNKLLWTMPIWITLAAGFRIFAMNRHFKALKIYMLKIAARFNAADSWEAQKRRWNIGGSNLVMGIVLIALALIGFYSRATLIKQVPVK